MAAPAAVTAVRPAPGNIFLPPETYNPVAALPGGGRGLGGRVQRTRNRPLPSGQVTLLGAYLWLGLQLLIGLAVLAIGFPLAGLVALVDAINHRRRRRG